MLEVIKNVLSIHFDVQVTESSLLSDLTGISQGNNEPDLALYARIFLDLNLIDHYRNLHENLCEIMESKKLSLSSM